MMQSECKFGKSGYTRHKIYSIRRYFTRQKAEIIVTSNAVRKEGNR